MFSRWSLISWFPCQLSACDNHKNMDVVGKIRNVALLYTHSVSLVDKQLDIKYNELTNRITNHQTC